MSNARRGGKSYSANQLKQVTEPTYSINKEIKELRKGKYVRIENKDVQWWEKRLRWKFFEVLENREMPVMVIQGNSTRIFSVGMNRSQVVATIRGMKRDITLN